MQMATNSSEERVPTFFKVIRYPSAPHLVLPTAFVKRYLEKIPKNPILKTAKGQNSWRLKIKKIGEDYCFTNGWEKLAKDVQLHIMDIVFVSLVDAFTFEVSFFDANGCEKDRPLNNTSDNENEGEVMPDEEEDDEVMVHEKDEDDVMPDKEDDDEVMSHEKDEDEHMPDEVMPHEKDDDEHMPDEVMPNENLCFQRVISEKSHRYSMTLPRKFVEAAELENKTGITVKDHEGKEWIMGLITEKHHNRRSLSSGWSLFRQYYKLSEGDICLFKFIKEEGVLILGQVLKNNRAKKQEIGNLKETPTNVEGVKRKRGRPRLEKPRNGGGGMKVKIEAEVAKRKRGRPRLEKPRNGGGGMKVKIEAEVAKRKRGRPWLEKPRNGGGGMKVKIEAEVVKRKRGRPPLQKHLGGSVDVKIEDQSGPEVEVVKRKRGRPQIEKRGGGVKIEDVWGAQVEAVKRKRGRPRVEKDGGGGGIVKIKIEEGDGSVVKRKGARPGAVEKGGVEVKTEAEMEVEEVKRNRGRPRLESLNRSHRVIYF